MPIISNLPLESSSGSSESGIPQGVICMWSGAADAIPDGWTLCNGENGAPDLRDRFLVGAGNSYTVGATGGADTVTLTTAQMPSHNHTVSLSGLKADSAGDHAHTIYISNSTGSSSYNFYVGRNNTRITTDTSSYPSMSSEGAHTHTISGSATIGNAGSGEAHENRPPYYALCFIMKV